MEGGLELLQRRRGLGAGGQAGIPVPDGAWKEGLTVDVCLRPAVQQVPSGSGAKVASGRWWPQLLVDCYKAVDDLEHKDAACIPTS